MPALLLTDIEARILGSLVEKSMTTPDQYPLSLNALLNACNQKTSRDPVMALDETTLARAIATLQEKGLVGRRSEPGSRVTKFMHHIENLIGGGTAREIGVITVLLLRGAQTPGEIKTRTDRMCEFESTAEVEALLLELSARGEGPYTVRLARQPGQKEARYMHLFYGPVQGEAAPSEKPRAPEPTARPTPAREEALTHLEKRLTALEAAVRRLEEQQSKDRTPS